MLNRTDAIQLARRAERYIGQVTGTTTHIHATVADRSLPIFLSDRYTFFEGEVAAQPCLFLVSKAGPLALPAALEKHFRTIQERFPHRPLLLILERLDSRARSRLIAHRIAFIVPDAQLYAPMLAMDLRERTPSAGYTRDVRHLSPSAQTLILAYLQHQPVEGEYASQLAQRMETTAMSIGRAFAEIEAFDLAAVATQGRERRLVFKYRARALWDKALPYLRSPVRKRRGVSFLPDDFAGLLAGEAALSRYTELATPYLKTYAVAARHWKTTAAQFQLEPSPSRLEEAFSIETWSYDPKALSQTAIVDQLSLYLSLSEMADERIHLAAKNLLEQAIA